MSSDLLRHARTFRFVPGDRPEGFEKALGSGAECAVVDLEDAVPTEEKARARCEVAALLDRGPHSVPMAVRVNVPHVVDGQMVDRPGVPRAHGSSRARLHS